MLLCVTLTVAETNAIASIVRLRIQSASLCVPVCVRLSLCLSARASRCTSAAALRPSALLLCSASRRSGRAEDEEEERNPRALHASADAQQEIHARAPTADTDEHDESGPASRGGDSPCGSARWRLTKHAPCLSLLRPPPSLPSCSAPLLLLA